MMAGGRAEGGLHYNVKYEVPVLSSHLYLPSMFKLPNLKTSFTYLRLGVFLAAMGR